MNRQTLATNKTNSVGPLFKIAGPPVEFLYRGFRSSPDRKITAVFRKHPNVTDMPNTTVSEFGRGFLLNRK